MGRLKPLVLLTAAAIVFSSCTTKPKQDARLPRLMAEKDTIERIIVGNEAQVKALRAKAFFYSNKADTLRMRWNSLTEEEMRQVPTYFSKSDSVGNEADSLKASISADSIGLKQKSAEIGEAGGSAHEQGAMNSMLNSSIFVLGFLALYFITSCALIIRKMLRERTS